MKLVFQSPLLGATGIFMQQAAQAARAPTARLLAYVTPLVAFAP